MCQVVVDFGNEIEMRALYTQQRKLIPMLTTFALVFAAFSFVLSWPRWAGQPSDNTDLLCAAGAVILAIGAAYEKRKTFERWMENMPKAPRIAGD